MADAQREGGVYNVGTDKEPMWRDANGKETNAPSGEKSGSEGENKQPATSAYPYADALSDGGFRTWDAVSGASNEDLLAVEGIGPARLAEIRAYKPE